MLEIASRCVVMIIWLRFIDIHCVSALNSLEKALSWRSLSELLFECFCHVVDRRLTDIRFERFELASRSSDVLLGNLLARGSG